MHAPNARCEESNKPKKKREWRLRNSGKLRKRNEGEARRGGLLLLALPANR